MELWEAILLGIVEGITEFLPISSTGHLTITEKLLGLKVDDVAVTAYTAIIQVGAMAAAIIYFRRDIVRIIVAFVRGLVSRQARQNPDWNLSLAVNLVAPAVLCRAAVDAFGGQDGGGIIVNLASRAAYRGEDPDYWHYAAAKAGVVAMTKTIARQYGRQGVTAFSVSPGYVDTAFNQEFAETVGVHVAAEQTGLGEVAQPQDVANVVAFLASGLARHATGTNIDVNGASYVR